MDRLETFPGLLGGLGLFLLGMRMLTEGLEVAAGAALRRFLERSTRTNVHALSMGMLITALVQSSSAVTVAIIGFVNAGILTLGRALWVIYGSSIGTSMTAWLVALLGFEVRIQAFSLPVIGVGMLLHLSGRGSRRGALGTALTGFGLLFEGLNLLRLGFQEASEGLSLQHLTGGGPLELLVLAAIGFALTVLMQSSSAAVAVILTATAGNVLGVPEAAAAVVGANVGTTSTAVLATIGATSNARRVAAGYVAFKGMTAVVALLLLPALLAGIRLLLEELSLEASPTVTLALFHTLFNVLGVLLIWPLAPRMERMLERRFRSLAELRSRPQHLDVNVLAVPDLALQALSRELARSSASARELALAAFAGTPPERTELERDELPLRVLLQAIGTWISRMEVRHMPPQVPQLLGEAIQSLQYQTTLAEVALDAADEREPAPAGVLEAQMREYLALCRLCIASADPEADGYDPHAVERSLSEVDRGYQALKSRLIQAGTTQEVEVPVLESLLTRINLGRRACRQAHKAALRVHSLRLALQNGPKLPALAPPAA